MNNNDLGQQPDPVIEEKEGNPGGADAASENDVDQNLARDLDPDDNPGVNDAMPEEIVTRDDEKSQSPDGEADDAESGTETDPQAGQEAEDGSVEPPA